MAYDGYTASVPVGDHRSICHALLDTARRCPNRVAFRAVDDSRVVRWSEVVTRVGRIAGGLAGRGVRSGDTVALMMGNRPEFHLVDLAVASLGAVPFSVYNTSSPQQVEHMLADSGAKLALVEHAFVGIVDAARTRPKGSGLADVVLIDGDDPDRMSLEELERTGDGFDLAAAVDLLGPDDLATLVYTSGTTGPPKGVEISHGNVLATLASMTAIIDWPEDSHLVSWLPAAHMAERIAHHYTAVLMGATVTCCSDPREIFTHLQSARPTWFFAVPRIWEKLKAGLEAAWAQASAEHQAQVAGALIAGRAVVAARQAGQALSTAASERHERAERDVFIPLRAALGLDRVEAINVGSAPCPPDVITFFHALGLPLSELWGMSETAAAGTVNPPGAIRIGTVGLPLPGVELQLAEDGEILVRSASVTRGYHNQPEATADAIDAEGWLHTGDVGRLDRDGYLTLIDRKKELIINAAGKNMSPANIEAALKASSPLVAHAVAIGDRRQYNVALLVLDADAASSWARNRGLGADLAALASSGELTGEIHRCVDQANARLSRVEQIKRFAVLADEWTVGGDLLTPTMKLKRTPIAQSHQHLIDGLYAKTSGTEVS